MVNLSTLKPKAGAVKKRKRVGRGPGSGHGKTSGRGHKGRRSRSGGNTPPGYEGGQMPLQRRLPKRGFRNPFGRDYAEVTLRVLDAKFPEGAVVEPNALVSQGIVTKKLPIKVLATGVITKALTVRAHAFSKKAKELIEAAGGSAEVI
ncbi:MAG: 50S ribosomal protein L15 [Candidatus Binatia bacterium]|nr:50S ribosomal protein L15 [Candidatus Binatia bacterium]